MKVLKKDTGVVVCGPGCHGWIEAPKITRTEKNKLAVQMLLL